MLNKRKAQYEAKEAFRLWHTTAHKVEGFTVQGSGSCTYVRDGWIVTMTDKGKIVRTHEPIRHD